MSREPIDPARDPEYGRCYDFISIMSSILLELLAYQY